MPLNVPFTAGRADDPKLYEWMRTVGQQALKSQDITSTAPITVTRGTSGTPVTIGLNSGLQPSALAYNTIAQSIPNATFTALTFDSNIYDNGVHSTTVNNSRFTVPSNSSGWYTVTAQVTWSASAAGATRLIALLKNGAVYLQQQSAANSGIAMQTCVSWQGRLDAGDYVEAHVYQDSGVALNTIGAAGNCGMALAYASTGVPVINPSIVNTGGLTSLSAGVGITLTPNPIVSTGAIALTVPVVPSSGGTGTTTAFTTGSVVFAGASGIYAQDNANLFFNDTTNRLGVGTAAPDSRLTASDNTVVPAAITDTTIHGVAADTKVARVALDSIGAATAFTGRRANGTTGALTGLVADDAIAQVTALGYTSAGAYSSGARGDFRIHASETWSGSAQGAYATIRTTPNGSTTIAERVRVDPAGNVGVGMTPARLLDVATSGSIRGKIQDYGGQVFNVLAYGADNTGSADAGGIINTAITDANAGTGGVVYLPPGTYKITTPITLKQNVSLIGAGMWSTLLNGNVAGDLVTIDGTASTNVYNAIRDLRIDSNATAVRCLVIKNAWFVDIDRCRIAGGSTEPVLVTSTAGVSSTHIQFSKCWLTTGSSTPVIHGTGNFVTGLQLNDCEISGGSSGVLMDATDGYDLACYGSIFEGVSGPGAKIEGSATASSTLIANFTDCYFEGNTTADIDINPSAATGSVPQVSVKGGQSVASAARFIRMNSKCGMLHVTGVYSNGHGTADIDLGDLSSTTAVISIQGNNLTSSTKISSTNPSVSGMNYPLNCVIVPLRLVSSAGLSTTSSTYQIQGYDIMPASRNFPPGAVYTLVAVLGVSNVATTATLRLANDGAGTVYGTASSSATGRNLVSATLSNIPTADTVMQQDLLSTDNTNTATWYGGWVKVTW